MSRSMQPFVEHGGRLWKTRRRSPLRLVAALLTSMHLRTCRLASLEELSGMEVLASDKTGTLTLNR